MIIGSKRKGLGLFLIFSLLGFWGLYYVLPIHWYICLAQKNMNPAESEECFGKSYISAAGGEGSIKIWENYLFKLGNKHFFWKTAEVTFVENRSEYDDGKWKNYIHIGRVFVREKDADSIVIREPFPGEDPSQYPEPRWYREKDIM